MATSAQAVAVKQRYSAGIWRWVVTTDHKDIGILYIGAALLFFFVGGLEALLIRIQLAQPGQTFLSPEAYNQLFTMHGLTMIFLFGMPILIGIANFLVPLMIGARDMAFPRINAFSFWIFLFGGLLLYSGFLLGGAPDAGWFAYAPLTIKSFSPGNGMDFYAMGIILTGVGSIAGAVNLIVTILNMRAPGMTMFNVPVFVWQILVTAILLLFAIPSLTVDTALLFLERRFGAPFFQVGSGGDPMLWQHLFWFFGHPEVYILILPAFGIISEVIPVFSKKPIFGYRALIYSGIAIGFLGFGVWAHHMFATGINPTADAFFSVSSMVIAVPTSVKIFNWIATMWGGHLDFKTPLLYAVGFIAMFIIGGLSGVAIAIVPFDEQVTDTYFIVAHLHYVLFGGTIFAVFSGIFYWFPKVTGRLFNEALGKWQFWLMMIGFNLTFLPMHYLGMAGMPRRVYTYASGNDWGFWNSLETVGSFLIGLAMLLFIWNVIKSLRSGDAAGNDPWDGFTLEWTISSPPPAYDFAVIPKVKSLRPLWDLKHPDPDQPSDRPASQPQVGVASQAIEPLSQGAHEREADGGHASHSPVHIPGQSFNPVIMGLGLTLFGYGMIYSFLLAAIGIVITFYGIVSFAWETP